MRSEGQFFKTLLMVFLAFYLSSLIVISLLAVVYVTDYDIYAFMAPFILGLISILFFAPVLIVVTFIQWWIQNIKLKNLFSFILLIIYGFTLFIHGLELFNEEKIKFFLISISSTLIFLLVLFYLMKPFTKKV